MVLMLMLLGKKSKKQENKSDIKKYDEKHIWDVLKTCYDPEIPVNIVDLGLVYDLKS